MKFAWATLQRDSRDVLFLLAVIAWLVLPQLPYLPAWCIVGTAVVLGWRGWLALSSSSGFCLAWPRARSRAAARSRCSLTCWSSVSIGAPRARGGCTMRQRSWAEPWKIKVVADRETKEKLFPATWGMTHARDCSHLLVLCADTDCTESNISKEARMRVISISRVLKIQFIKIFIAYSIFY